MYRSTRQKAMMKDTRPAWMDSAPREGPTTCSWTIVAGAGSLPDLRTLVRSVASSMEKLPVISEEPPVISLMTLG